MAEMGRIPTDDEIREAARLLCAGGFNGEDPAKAVYANRLVEQAGPAGGQVVSRIAAATADFDRKPDGSQE